ncbi:hypothetical protein KP509_03G096400 [Ceratopteris richardii]|nr:hypothetical protein KP509_03G096400 [Ceratopteris richardii]
MQHKSPSTVDDLLGAQTIEGLEGNVVSYGEETEQLGVHGQSLYGRKLTANETMLATSVLNLLESTGWTEITRGYLIEIQSQKLSFPVVSKILIQLKDFYLVSSLFQWVCKHIGHDVQVYHAYLRALIKTKQFMKMWDFLDRMRDNSIEISIATFCLMIKECRISGEPAMAVKVFNKAPHYGVELNNVLHQCLLSSLFLSNLAQEAKLLYRKMVCENCILDVHIFNTLIHGFGLSSSKEDVNKSFQLMLQAGIKPNLSSYKALIAAFCNVHLVDAAILTFFRLKDASFEVDASILNVLVEGLCGMDMFDNAIDIISKVQMWCPPDVSTGIILLKWLLSKNEVSRAIDMFLSMEEGGFTNRWAYIALSNGLRRCNQTTEIRHFLLDLFARYGYANLEVCHALLYSLTSCGDVAKSEELFKGVLESTTEPILCFYATMISFYCRRESVEQALHLLLDLKNRGYRPGVFCYAPIMSALIKAGQPKYALRCFEEMQECGCEINGVMCDFLLRGLCKHEMVADVPHIVDTILRNKFSMSASTFMELVKCMCKAGKIEEANILFKSLHGLSCLQIGKEAAKQAASVIRVMSKP